MCLVMEMLLGGEAWSAPRQSILPAWAAVAGANGLSVSVGGGFFFPRGAHMNAPGFEREAAGRSLGLKHKKPELCFRLPPSDTR